jgi:hypothetical protein
MWWCNFGQETTRPGFGCRVVGIMMFAILGGLFAGNQ